MRTFNPTWTLNDLITIVRTCRRKAIVSNPKQVGFLGIKPKAISPFQSIFFIHPLIILLNSRIGRFLGELKLKPSSLFC